MVVPLGGVVGVQPRNVYQHRHSWRVASHDGWPTTIPGKRSSAQLAAQIVRRRLRTGASESVKPRRVVDQDRLADGGIRRPDGELIEQPAVVDLVQRPHFGGLEL